MQEEQPVGRVLSDEEASRFLGNDAEINGTKAWLVDTFSTEAQALAFKCEPGKKFSVYWHTNHGFFGIRVMNPRKTTGISRRTWICRHRDARKKDQKKPAGPNRGQARTGKMDDALFAAMKMRRDAQIRRDAGIPDVPYFLEAYTTHIKLGKKWSEATKLMYEKAIKNLEDLWTVRCDKITSAICEDIVEKIEKRVVARYKTFKNPKVKRTGTPTAREAMRVVRAIFNSLMEEGIVTHNPTARLERFDFFDQGEVKTDAIDPDEMHKVWGWLNTKAHASVRDYILIALSMGFRRSILGSLKWDNVDHKKRVYRVDKKDIGNKAKRDFEMPIPDGLYDLVFAPRFASDHGTWIIESPKKVGKPLKSIRGSLAALHEDTKVALTPHSLRRSAATFMKACAGEVYAARLMTHRLDAKGAKSSNTARYIISREKDLKKAMNDAWDFLMEIVQKGAPE